MHPNRRTDENKFLPMNAACTGARRATQNGEVLETQRLRTTEDAQEGEASRRVAQLEGVIRKARKWREVLMH